MTRITRDQMLMGFANLAAKRSTCLRLQVGAVIADEGRVISTGYAGAPAGLPHCSPETCGPGQPCTATVHAEASAIAFAARTAIAVEGATMYCTHSPCLECAKLIINAGIKHVVYGTLYRKTEGVELLTRAGIATSHYFAGEEAETEGCGDPNCPSCGWPGFQLPEVR